MGTESELKLHLDSEAQLQAVLAWDALSALRVGTPFTVEMQTTYYDTLDGGFSSRHWTVRRRMENGRSVICVKTPRLNADSLLRGEWEVEAPSLEVGLPKLVDFGAPQELPRLAQKGVVAVCGAQFLRRAQLLALSDDTTCELALDTGELFKGETKLPFFELELELKSGSETLMRHFGQRLCAQFFLHAEPKSKFARARAL